MSFDLDTPLFNFSDERETKAWTIKNAVESVAVFGGIGSGKTSGSGAFLLKRYLKHGFGGIILTAKAEERGLIEKYCRETGRSKDLIIVSPRSDNKHYFNFLEYLSSQGSERTFTSNLVQVLKTVLNSRQEKNANQGDSAFWQQSMETLLTNSIDLVLMAYGKVTVSMLYNVILSVMQEKEDSAFNKAYQIVAQNVADQIEVWAQQTGVDFLSSLDALTYNEMLFRAVPQARQLSIMHGFFFDTYKQISSKTRTLIEFMFIGFVFPLLRDPLYSIFCDSPSTFSPEDCLNGSIVLIDLPVKIYNAIGRDIQILVKYIFQLSFEKRNIEENDRPVFIYADEAQHFIHEYDTEFQATARGNRICTVYLSQNISNYYACMGGDRAEHKVRAFLSTLNTQIFHCNADIEKTNKYASELIGQAWQADETESITEANGSTSTSKSISVKLQHVVRPEAFTNLLTGAKENNFRISAYIHIQGKKFITGFNHRKIHFTQNS